MTGEDSIEASAKRLSAAMDALELALSRQAVAGKAVGELAQELQTVLEDRSRLAQELDRLKQRNVKLEEVSSEVSRRLDAALGAIEAMLAGGR